MPYNTTNQPTSFGAKRKEREREREKERERGAGGVRLEKKMDIERCQEKFQ